MGSASGADDTDRVLIPLAQFSPNVEDDGRRMDFPKRPRIRLRILCDHPHTEIADPFKLGSKIDSRFPAGNLIGNLVANSFDLSKVAPFRREDLLRFPENFQQFPHPHRPNGRQHIECDTGFGSVHIGTMAGASSPSSIGIMPMPRLKWDFVLVRLRFRRWFRRRAGLTSACLSIFATCLGG